MKNIYSKEIESGNFKIHYEEEEIDGTPTNRLTITNGCPAKLCLESPYQFHKIKYAFKQLNAIGKAIKLTENDLVRIICASGICKDPKDIHSQEKQTEKETSNLIKELDLKIKNNLSKEAFLTRSLQNI